MPRQIVFLVPTFDEEGAATGGASMVADLVGSSLRLRLPEDWPRRAVSFQVEASALRMIGKALEVEAPETEEEQDEHLQLLARMDPRRPAEPPEECPPPTMAKSLRDELLRRMEGRIDRWKAVVNAQVDTLLPQDDTYYVKMAFPLLCGGLTRVSDVTLLALHALTRTLSFDVTMPASSPGPQLRARFGAALPVTVSTPIPRDLHALTVPLELHLTFETLTWTEAGHWGQSALQLSEALVALVRPPAPEDPGEPGEGTPPETESDLTGERHPTP